MSTPTVPEKAAPVPPEPPEDALVFDPRTEKNLATLTPKAQRAAKLLLAAQNKALLPSGLVARITHGYRPAAEQDALYNQPTDGKDNDGDGKVDEPDERVTGARGGESWHQYRVAWDITIFRIKGGAPVWDPKPYERAAAVALDFPGLERGIDWAGRKKDRPHYQLALGITVAQAKARAARGEAVG